MLYQVLPSVSLRLGYFQDIGNENCGVRATGAVTGVEMHVHFKPPFQVGWIRARLILRSFLLYAHGFKVNIFRATLDSHLTSHSLHWQLPSDCPLSRTWSLRLVFAITYAASIRGYTKRRRRCLPLSASLATMVLWHGSSVIFSTCGARWRRFPIASLPLRVLHAYTRLLPFFYLYWKTEL